MWIKHDRPVLQITFLLIVYTLIFVPLSRSADPPGSSNDEALAGLGQAADGPETNGKILVELFLAKERKEDLNAIRKEFEALGITRIRPQFFRLGHPPENIAIGKDIPADVARLAIRLAVTYNGNIKTILPEFRYFPNHIVIGTSAFDEASEIPIQPEDLKRLSDPSLTTAQFHELYRHLTGEDQRNPTYLDK